MGPEAILLSVKDDGREGSYRFTCPSCADDVEKRADRKIVALLVSAGVDIAQSERELQSAMLFDDEDAGRSLPSGPAFSIDIGLGAQPRAGRYEVSIWGKTQGQNELFMVSLRTIVVK